MHLLLPIYGKFTRAQLAHQIFFCPETNTFPIFHMRQGKNQDGGDIKWILKLICFLKFKKIAIF
jgi:hypothetical protein